MKRRIQGRKIITDNVDGSIISEKDNGVWGKCFGRSLMNAGNRVGPRVEPCGTPEDTGGREARRREAVTNTSHAPEIYSDLPEIYNTYDFM